MPDRIEQALEEHYAVVRCACGFTPGDDLSDGAACGALLAHIIEEVSTDA